MTEPTASPVLETGATHRPRAAHARRVSAFWLAYAAGQEEAVAGVAVARRKRGDAGDGHGDGHGDGRAGDDGDACDAMPMDAWLALSDAEQAAIVAAYLAPSGAARAPAPQRGAFDPARATALLSAMRSGESLTCAARALGIGRTTIRRWMAERPDFAAQVDALQAARQALRQAARRRGKRRAAASR